MNIEIRADGAHISGYVNATEKKSRPVITPHGKVIEEIEPRAFEGALSRAGEVTLMVDHNPEFIYARTTDETLVLYEDAIGLHADVVITDPEIVEIAKQGRIRGWSFGMYNVVDELVEREGDIPLRKVSSLDLDHVSLIVNKTPAYSATSVEIRADSETIVETRMSEEPLHITVEDTSPSYDNSAFRRRADALKK